MLEATVRALARLRAQDASGLGQGLSPENAQACLHQAIRPLNRESLAAAVRVAGVLPKSVAIVVPYGVFTTPIEWTAIAAAGGASVHLKAPVRDSAFVRLMTEVFAREGLPVTWSTDRALPPVDAVLAFGSDASVESIRAESQAPVVVGYGHRFSVAYVAGNPEVAARSLMVDLVRYDGRGCMAPVAIFCSSDSALLAKTLAAALRDAEAVWPRGSVDPSLGPEWRRRLGLARITGTVVDGDAWAVTTSPPSQFTPTALPRMATIHPISERRELDQWLAPWAPWLSTLGTDAGEIELAGVHRVCRLGWMQAPIIPRNHDGRTMLGGLHSSNGDDQCG